MRDRQTDVRRASLLNAPAVGRGHIKTDILTEEYSEFRSINNARKLSDNRKRRGSVYSHCVWESPAIYYSSLCVFLTPYSRLSTFVSDGCRRQNIFVGDLSFKTRRAGACRVLQRMGVADLCEGLQ